MSTAAPETRLHHRCNQRVVTPWVEGFDCGGPEGKNRSHSVSRRSSADPPNAGPGLRVCGVEVACRAQFEMHASNGELIIVSFQLWSALDIRRSVSEATMVIPKSPQKD